MGKEDLIVLAQLLSAMKDNLDDLESAERSGDGEKIAIVKKEILEFQRKVDELL